MVGAAILHLRRTNNAPGTKTMKTLFAFLCVMVATAVVAADRLEEHSFGAMPDGTAVKQFVLRNDNGMVVRLISYGATVSEILVPDREGRAVNVIQGSDQP